MCAIISPPAALAKPKFYPSGNEKKTQFSFFPLEHKMTLFEINNMSQETTVKWWCYTATQHVAERKIHVKIYVWNNSERTFMIAMLRCNSWWQQQTKRNTSTVHTHTVLQSEGLIFTWGTFSGTQCWFDSSNDMEMLHAFKINALNH